MLEKNNNNKNENRAQALRCTLVPDFAILSRQTPSSKQFLKKRREKKEWITICILNKCILLPICI